MSGLVYNPVPSNLGDGAQQQNNVFGRQGEQLDGDLHGKYFNAAVRKNVYKANVTAKTILQVAANVASQFSFFNPSGSGVLAEIITTEVGLVLPTTAPDTLAWYYITANQIAAAGNTPPVALVAGTNYFSARVGDTPNAQCIPYGTYTYGTSITPTRVELIASMAATSATGDQAINQPYKNHDGMLIVPPGIFMTVLASTGAYTGSALDLGITWAEWPFM